LIRRSSSDRSGFFLKEKKRRDVVEEGMNPIQDFSEMTPQQQAAMQQQFMDALTENCAFKAVQGGVAGSFSYFERLRSLAKRE